jgi:hypothetical protein
MESVKEKYQKDDIVFNKIIDLQYVYSNPPSTLTIYTTRQKIKDKILLNVGKYIVNDIKRT